MTYFPTRPLSIIDAQAVAGQVAVAGAQAVDAAIVGEGGHVRYRVEVLDEADQPVPGQAIEGLDIAGVLLFQLNERLTDADHHRLHTSLRESFRGRTVVVLDPAVRFVRLVADEPAAAAQPAPGESVCE